MDAIITGLNILFSPVLGFPPLVAEAIVVGIFTFIASLFSKFLTNQEHIRKMNEEMKALQMKLKDSKPEDANKYSSEFAKYYFKQISANKWAMLASTLLFILISGWLSQTFLGKVVITIPVVNVKFGWLVYFIVLSLAFSALFRKLLKLA